MGHMGFLEAFDAILEVAGRPAHAARVADMRRTYERRAGAFGPEDAWFEPRSRAFWDDALTTQAFAREVLGELPEHTRGWARCLHHAHRGLFFAELVSGQRVLRDVWGGGAFLVDELDDASRDALDAPSGPFDARLVALPSPVTVSLLPGAVFHREDALEPLMAVLAAARARALSTGDALDALLRMELSLRVMSRVKPAYAYRPEGLSPPR
jgi:hypothetical protein